MGKHSHQTYCLPHPRIIGALESVCIATRLVVEKAAKGGQGYTAVQYAAAALEVLNSKHKAVPEATMELVVGQYAEPIATPRSEDEVEVGKNVLQAMVKANAFALRPQSKMARDVPAEAFAPQVPGEPVGKMASVVTAPTAVHLFCMKLCKGHMEARLAKSQQRQQVRGQLLVMHRAIAGCRRAVICCQWHAFLPVSSPQIGCKPM
jgi:hypothetical protein